MNKKIKDTFYVTSFIIFFILLILFYVSENNVKNTSKSRAFHEAKLNNNIENLPLLSNDTSNIIEYSNDLENFKKRKKKYLFFNLLEK
jgi:hypothetical protein